MDLLLFVMNEMIFLEDRFRYFQKKENGRVIFTVKESFVKGYDTDWLFTGDEQLLSEEKKIKQNDQRRTRNIAG